MGKHKEMIHLRDLYCQRSPGDNWIMADEWGYGYRFLNSKLGLSVIQTASLYDGAPWLHTSISRRDLAIPTYNQLALVKKDFVGPKRLAIQLFVPEEEHVNIHPGVLHLWTPLEHSPLPDFRTIVNGIAMI